MSSVDSLIEVFEIQMDFIWIDFQVKMYENEMKFINACTFLTFCEKQKLIDETYNKYQIL